MNFPKSGQPTKSAKMNRPRDPQRTNNTISCAGGQTIWQIRLTKQKPFKQKPLLIKKMTKAHFIITKKHLGDSQDTVFGTIWTEETKKLWKVCIVTLSTKIIALDKECNTNGQTSKLLVVAESRAGLKSNWFYIYFDHCLILKSGNWNILLILIWK